MSQRIYVVVKNSYSPTSVGIWSGPHPDTWNALAEHLRGGQLLGSGAKLQRVPTMMEAQGAWNEAVARRMVTGEPAIYQV